MTGPRSDFFWLFQAQALLVVLFGLPFFAVAARTEAGWTAWDAAGLLVWAAAVAGEWTADRQLSAFRGQAANRGRTCDRGLWRYSRHPNYFFEWIHWWAYALMAAGSPTAWLAWIGPPSMLFLLYRVTGIPYTEKRALASHLLSRLHLLLSESGLISSRIGSGKSLFFHRFPLKYH